MKILYKRPSLFNAPLQLTPTLKSEKFYKRPGRLIEKIRYVFFFLREHYAGMWTSFM